VKAPALYLFDDGRARRWAPFSLTRPIGELTFGHTRLRKRMETAFATTCRGHLSRGALSGFTEIGAAPVVSMDAVDTEAGAVFISSRAVLTEAVGALAPEAARIEVDGVTVGWVIPPGGDLPSELWLRDPATSPGGDNAISVNGSLLDHPWDLMEQNTDRLIADLGGRAPQHVAPDGVIMIGNHGIFMADGAEVEAGVVLDTRSGPISLSVSVRVEGPARLVGPLFVGEGTIILGGPVGHASIGRHCKVRGEVWECVIGDYVNKAHEGHLGHALIGSWVNLGAGTTNSDLKNNYGTVTVWTPDGDVDTGRIKVGCFLGDHVKTGIGTLLNTGTVIGAGSNIFGGAMPPVAVPPFSWGTGAALTTHRIDKFLETTERVMARRGLDMDEKLRGLFERAWSLTESQRSE
jgi:UDP-N-acetylglucosamine diphosphorylase/glucosamine-1-phosphate N-acetyltransferase